MKKPVKKLQVSRESLKVLSAPELTRVGGASLIVDLKSTPSVMVGPQTASCIRALCN